MNQLNWKDRSDGSGSVARSTHSTYEIERLEVMTGVSWFRVRRLANARGPDIGGSGTLEGAKIITKADSSAAGLCPLARA
jgi:hypothetical protein